jgi:LPS-assembly protein
MKPSVRTASECRRLLVLCATAASLTGPLPEARAADALCPNPAAQDPRLEELAQSDPDDPSIDIKSDAGEMERDGNASLRGNVRIRLGQRLLTADEADIDAEERNVSMRGRVEYLDPTLHVRGDGGSFAGAGTAEFRGAEFELLDRSVRGAAGEVHVREQGVVELADVSYTACPPGNEDWELSADDISLNQRSRIGTGRDVRLDFKGVPVLYTPWISFPIGDQRKTGVLFPIIGNSGQSGTMLAVPWYWNIAPNRDATLFTRYYSSRGLRLDPEFRYLSQSSRGIVYGEYLYEDTQFNDSRSFVEWRHATRFRPRTRLHIDAANVSDPTYFEDFGAGFEGTSITFLNRSAELRHDTRHWSLIGRAQDYQVIDELLADVDQPYTIAPQLGAYGHWRDLPGGFSAALRAEAGYFDREVGPQGLRVDVEPAVGWRIEGRGSYLAADAALRHTGYTLDDVEPGFDDAPSRTAPIVSLDTGLVFDRTVGSHGQRLHTLEPRLLYLYVPFREQDELPVFDTALPDLNLVQLFRTNRYVGTDRLSDANQLAVGLTSRLLDAAGGRQYVSATIGQAFYFEDPQVRLPDEPEPSRGTSDVVGELEMLAFQDWSARLGARWDPENTHFAKSEVALQYRPASDRVANVGYRLQRDSIEQMDLSAAWPIKDRWRAFGRWVYSMRDNQTLDWFVGLQYRSCCWGLSLVTRHFVSSRTGDTDTTIGLQLELRGLSNVGVDNEAFLRGAIRGYSAVPDDPEP